MRNLLFNLAAYRHLLAMQLRGQMQYRIAFLLEILATLVVMLLFFVSLMLVFERFGSLGGWQLGEVALLWGLVETAFGLMDLIFSGFDPSGFGARIRRGHFDQLLLRPVNITVQVLGDRFILRRVGRILQGVIILIIALNLAEIQWTLGKICYLPLVVGGMVAFFGGLFVIGATITFWTVESIEAMNILTYGSNEMMQYPMHIYPTGLQRFFTYVVPAMLLNYQPALYLLDRPDPLGLPVGLRFVSPLVGLSMLWMALRFWRFGIRHYQSTGT